MTAVVAHRRPLTPFEYELLATSDTVAGEAAWNAGDYRRATALWMSAARWSQFASRAEGGELR